MKSLTLLFSLMSTIIFAGDFTTTGAKATGMGRCSISLPGFWTSFNNQGALADFNSAATAIFYENRFVVKELGVMAGGVIIPAATGNFGIVFNRFGYSGFNKNKIGLAFGKKFGKHFNFGLQLDYLLTHIADNLGNKSNFTFELGFKSQLNDNLVFAGHIFNPIPIIYLQKETDDKIPAVFTFGASYSFPEKFILTIETEKETGYKPLLRFGMEYQLIEKVSIRTGYSTLPSLSGYDSFSIASLFTMGFSIHLNGIDMDFATSYHSLLGWSPSFSAIFKFGKK